ncbi:MAG: EscU/YscU/HrcU family type III secretion system export apparatus switch protein [Shewanella fodinae]|nr:EscU/YscU/HrcU family type III secretion system export apparatus switch protein [Shewanella fodinae]
MADTNSSQERTEAPSERRLKEARKEGKVARSRELNTAVLMMIGIAAFFMVCRWFDADVVNCDAANHAVRSIPAARYPANGTGIIDSAD